MTTAVPKLIVKSPSACSNVEIGAFIAFVRAGGEVSIQGLVEKIRSAVALALAYLDGLIVGVSALKRPQASYRRRVNSSSGTPLPETEFPFELGWVYVAPDVRRKGFSLLLSEAAIASSVVVCSPHRAQTMNLCIDPLPNLVLSQRVVYSHPGAANTNCNSLSDVLLNFKCCEPSTAAADQRIKVNKVLRPIPALAIAGIQTFASAETIELSAYPIGLERD